MQTIDRLRRKSKDAAKNPFNLSGWIILSIGGLTVYNSLVLSIVMGALNNLAHQKTPTLVQRVDGRAEVVSPLETRKRIPMVVRRFAVESLTALMNASGKAAALKGQKDPGVSLRIGNSEKRLPTTVWQAGFTLSGDFRNQLLQRIGMDIPTDVFEGRYERVLIPKYVSDPESVSDREGEWKVNIIADLQTISMQNPAGIVEPFNKTVTVRAIDSPEPTSELNSPIAKDIYSIREAGLEITDIRDYQQP